MKQLAIDGDSDYQFQPAYDAVLLLRDGTFFHGYGCGKKGQITGELCFNTSMTGYQEILTDLSYHAQIICFTFPHIGNTGANALDLENIHMNRSGTHDGTHGDIPIARAAVFRNKPTIAANYRSQEQFGDWLANRRITAIYGIDTRMITQHLREKGMMNAVLAYYGKDAVDIPVLLKKLQLEPSMQGRELARKTIFDENNIWRHTYDKQSNNWHNQAKTPARLKTVENNPKKEFSKKNLHALVLDFGCKYNILNSLGAHSIEVSCAAGSSRYEDIESLNADGYIISNGPGDPLETARYAMPLLRKLINSGKPVYGVCLGHQLLAIALGAKTTKMLYGHHGANHPVIDLQSGKVSICSMNHGFSVESSTIPMSITETQRSLFDNVNCAIRTKDGLIHSVQYHPEASPGPHDNNDFFTQFVDAMASVKKNVMSAKTISNHPTSTPLSD